MSALLHELRTPRGDDASNSLPLAIPKENWTALCRKPGAVIFLNHNLEGRNDGRR